MSWFQPGAFMDDQLAALAVAWACFALVVLLLADRLDKKPRTHRWHK